MFTRTFVRKRGHASRLARLLRAQLRPTRPLPEVPAGIVVDGQVFYPAECCTEHQQDTEDRMPASSIAAAMAAGMLAFASLAAVASGALGRYIARLP